MGNSLPEMKLHDVIEIVQLFDQHHIEFYVDGGWGVDALLGKQTRPHADLDIAIQHKDSPQVRALLEARGYSDVHRADSSDFNFVLGRSSRSSDCIRSINRGKSLNDEAQTSQNRFQHGTLPRFIERIHQIDIHTYTFDAAGNHIYGIPYPLESLSGNGSMDGHPVKCISPEWVVKFHTAYQFDEDDYRDVKAICQHFDIKMPLEYEEFEHDFLRQGGF
jgi:lincosamide nucleotidyltransferase A/C/D/E